MADPSQSSEKIETAADADPSIRSTDAQSAQASTPAGETRSTDPDLGGTWPEEPVTDDEISAHAPPNWMSQSWATRVREAAAPNGPRLPLLVLAADIRKSTYLMKESINPRRFAGTLRAFLEVAREEIHEKGGWWDKFTGDGFLAYWPFEMDTDEKVIGSDAEFPDLWEVVDSGLQVMVALLGIFDSQVIPSFRADSQNFPKGVGLSFGVDAGPANLVRIAHDVTIVGQPVVGAVRMVASSNPWDSTANVYLGEWLYRRQSDEWLSPIEVFRDYRMTKEYEQEVYRINFRRFHPDN